MVELKRKYIPCPGIETGTDSRERPTPSNKEDV